MLRLLVKILILIIVAKTLKHWIENHEEARLHRDQFWPMEYKYTNGVYEVALQYRVDTRLNASRITVPERLVRRNTRGSQALTFNDLVLIHDNQWQLPIHPLAYRVHPQVINVSDFVDRLLANQSIAEVFGISDSCFFIVVICK